MVAWFRAAIHVDLLAPLAGSEDPTTGLVAVVAGVVARAARTAAAHAHEPVIVEQLAAHRATLRRALRNALEWQDPIAGGEALDRRSSVLAAVAVGINVTGRAGMSRAARAAAGRSPGPDPWLVALGDAAGMAPGAPTRSGPDTLDPGGTRGPSQAAAR